MVDEVIFETLKGEYEECMKRFEKLDGGDNADEE